MNNLNEVDWSQLPKPEDDGGADHLKGTHLPSVPLAATDGKTVDLSASKGLTVVYIYPMTGRPDTPLPDGWDGIPGARGCTPQSCAFRDHHNELKRLGVDCLFGLSTQASDYQREAVERLHLPFSLLSDTGLALGRAMKLPMFEVEALTLLKRLTLIIRDGTVEAVFYPVFPPDKAAEQIIGWLSDNSV